jgi:hypothetical protein
LRYVPVAAIRFICLLSAGLLPLLLSAEQRETRRIVSKTEIADWKMRFGVIGASEVRLMVLSPDGRSCAYVENTAGNRIRVVWNKRAGKNHDRVTTPVFSPEGTQLMYIADGSTLVVNDLKADTFRRGKKFPEVLLDPPPVFSPDGRRIAYVAAYGRLGSISAGRSATVVDENEGKHYFGIKSGPLFSPDSRSVAYGANVGDEQWAVVIDGVEGKVYDDVDNIRFSHQASRVAYAAKAGRKWFVVIDGMEGKPYNRIGTLGFDPFGSSVVYSAKSGGKWIVVTDAREGKPYDEIGDIHLSPGLPHLVYAARMGKKWFIVSDGREGAGYDNIEDGSLSLKCGHVSFIGTRGSLQYVVVDSTDGIARPRHSVRNKTLIFSQDCKRTAFVLKDDNGVTVVLDGQSGREFRAVGDNSLAFGPDSKAFSYVAKTTRGWTVMLNGTEGDVFDDILGGPFFDSPTTFHYVARDHSKAFLVEEALDISPGELPGR